MDVDAIDEFAEPRDASGVVGTWDWDCVQRTTRYDAGAAELLAGDAGFADRPLQADVAIAGIHHEDARRISLEMQRTIEAGDLVLHEYRVVSPTRGTRWLLSRGRVYRDPHGRAVRCRGILIDITEDRHDLRDDYPPYLARPSVLQEDPLSRAAACCLEARRLLAEEAGASHLHLLLDMAAYEIGCRMARRTGG